MMNGDELSGFGMALQGESSNGEKSLDLIPKIYLSFPKSK